MTNRQAYQAQLERRMKIHKEFYRSKEAGDLLVYINGSRTPNLEGFLCRCLYEQGAETATRPEAVRTAIQKYVASLRAAYERFYAIDDDCVPCAIVYWGIGSITAAMVGGTPIHDGSTSWLEPNLSWPEADALKFAPDNKWLRFAVEVNKALWENWDYDFMVLPFLHRSPLDAANGIRGTDLFLDVYEHPERVLVLADWCADWSISVETLIKREAPRPAGWGVGVWGVWLPDDAVFVNGDPVGLISREQAEIFDRPSNEKLFANTGGGFFHNHTIGLHQVGLVSSYKNNIVQWFVNDPKQPSLAESLLDHPDLREQILAASLQCPIGGGVPYERLDALLDIVSNGRFILSVQCPPEVNPDSLIHKMRKVSNAF